MSHIQHSYKTKAVIAFLLLCIFIPKDIFSATPPITTHSIDASAVVGANGWYISAVPITLSSTAGTDPIRDITHWIDNDTATISTANPATRTLIAQGAHTLRYYATDVNNLNESSKSFDYKIDLVAPGTWNGFTLTNTGNSHTFSISVNVADKTSGLDPSTASFQYSVDDGSTWGYYSNLTQCNSTWNNNQWRAATVAPNTPGSLTGQINIPSTDYCNSNWSQTKYIRIKIKDMAGLESTKQYALMSPWLQTTGGDVYSKSRIDMLTENGPGATGIVMTASDTINNMTSTSSWNVKNYSVASQPFYSTFYNKFGSLAATLPNSMPTTLTSSVYETDDLVIAGSYIPPALQNAQNLGIIVFVNGDLFIDTNIQLHPSSSIIWIVSGNIGIRSSVTRADGIYFADGEFDSSYNGNSNSQLLINGSIASTTGMILSRSLSNTNNLTIPAERIVFNPSIFLNQNLINLMKINSDLTWKEYITY
jgi:hypothetical protein